MSGQTSTSASSENLQRRIGLRSAVLFNMLEMIGVGPFITLPLVIAAAGFRLSVWAWVLGAVIAQGALMHFCARFTALKARETG
jgi:hypothetical protein